MMRNRFVLGLSLVAVLVGIALFVGMRAPEVPERAFLVAGLEDQLNNVTGLVARHDAGSVTLTRVEDHWQVAQADGYRADTGALRRFLIALSEARLEEEKSSRTENHARLGVVEPGEADAEGTGIVIALTGIEAPEFVIGNAARGGGRYVRFTDSPTVWLTGADLTFDTSAEDWLDQSVVDLDAAQVRSVAITHPDGQRLELSRPSAEVAELGWDNPPEGAQIGKPGVVREINRALTALEFKNVRRLAAQGAGPQERIEARYALFDGLVVTALASTGETSTAVTFSASAEPVAVADAEPVIAPAVAAQAAALNRRWDGWVYELSKFKHDKLTHLPGAIVADD